MSGICDSAAVLQVAAAIEVGLGLLLLLLLYLAFKVTRFVFKMLLLVAALAILGAFLLR